MRYNGPTVHIILWIYVTVSLELACLGCLAPHDAVRTSRILGIPDLSEYHHSLGCCLVHMFNIFGVELSALRRNNQQFVLLCVVSTVRRELKE